jgi:hypothetical protein
MAEFAMNWRLTDPRWANLPPAVLERIKPLRLAKAKQVSDLSPSLAQHPRPVDPELYQIVERCSLHVDTPTELGTVGRWLGHLPLDDQIGVYVCWLHFGTNRGIAVITDWGTVKEAWDDLWYPFDILSVFDDSLDWTVILGPEEEALFATRCRDVGAS